MGGSDQELNPPTARTIVDGGGGREGVYTRVRRAPRALWDDSTDVSVRALHGNPYCRRMRISCTDVRLINIYFTLYTHSSCNASFINIHKQTWNDFHSILFLNIFNYLNIWYVRLVGWLCACLDNKHSSHNMLLVRRYSCDVGFGGGAGISISCMRRARHNTLSVVSPQISRRLIES